ncbi:MAG TPA: TetR/AcrR family transcriptional regulator [Anaerolineales bacterium]|nr:TetR/AcrR family transcriptional regulator [Anaerolineales bacterium]
MSEIKLADRRVTKTLYAIETAFLDALNEKNLQKLTINDITERADINRSTFYEYFTDKYELFNHIIRKTFEKKMLEHLSGDFGVYSDENMGNIIRAVSEYFQYLNLICPPADRHLRPIAEAQVQVVLYHALTCWYPPDERTKLNAKALFVSWAIFGTLLEAIANGKGSDPFLISQQVFAMTKAVLENNDT